MKTKMTASSMTRKEFDALPYRKGWSESVECASIVILPGRANDLHDSGYRSMDFVAVDNMDHPICRLSGCSDVIHFDGIGGYGEWTAAQGIPRVGPISGWSIDCLAKSGLLRIFPHTRKMRCGASLSSFEIYSVKDR